MGVLGRLRAVGVAARSRLRGGRAVVDMGHGVMGRRRVVVVTSGAGRPDAGAARHEGQGEHRPGDAEPGRSRARPETPSLQHQDGQRAG
jgi:hypothetical protein